MRAFIFSLDSFVAFTLALVAIYTLIFFSAIPSSYYYLLTQGHYLAKDALYSLSTSDCLTPQFSCAMARSSLLDNIVFTQDSGNRDLNIRNSIGNAVPNQFGYVLEVSQDNGGTWAALYDTSSASGDAHAKAKRKLSVSSQVLAFKNPDDLAKNDPNPFVYRSCNAGSVLTCSKSSMNPPTGDYVPTPGFRLVRLTIFI